MAVRRVIRPSCITHVSALRLTSRLPVPVLAAITGVSIYRISTGPHQISPEEMDDEELLLEELAGSTNL